MSTEFLIHYKKKPGIYRILNTIDEKFYIGSAKDLHIRLHLHKSKLKKGIHHSRYLQNSFNKYGAEAFKFEILEECSHEILLEREQHYIDTLDPQYNMRSRAQSNLGHKWNEESRRKISVDRRKGPIYEYDLSGRFIREWTCALEASKELGYTYSSVVFNLSGKFKRCLDSIFKFEKLAFVEPYVFKYTRKQKPSKLN